MRPLLALSVSAAALALMVALYAMYSSEADSPPVDRIERDVADLRGRARSLEERVRELSSRFATLAGEFESLRAAPSGTTDPRVKPSTAGDASERLEELSIRFEEMATKLEEIESRSRGVVISGSPGPPETEEERTRTVRESQAVALDRSLPAAERLAALRNLRFRDGRSREVTLAMIELIEDPSVDAVTRADIIRNLHGVDFEELKQPLLTVLENDVDNGVRSETVETLEPFYGDPRVFGAVAQVRDNDPNPRIRLEAMERLLRYQNGRSVEPSER